MNLALAILAFATGPVAVVLLWLSVRQFLCHMDLAKSMILIAGGIVCAAVFLNRDTLLAFLPR